MKKWIAVLLAGMMACTGAAGISAEELTSGEELSSYEEAGEYEYAFDEEYANEEDDPELVWDGMEDEENEAEDLEDEELDMAGAASGTCGDNLTYTLNNGVLTISGTGKIWDNAFEDNDDIKSVIIKNGVTAIGKQAFHFCWYLKSVSIPNSVKTIGDGAFSYCDSLEKVVIPNGVTSLGSDCFSGCGALTNATIPQSVTSISDECFAFCFALMYITIPKSIKSVGDFAFSFCGLEELYFMGNAPTFGYEVFSEVDANVYYINNSSWTSSVREDYGGDITWTPMNKTTITGFYNSVKGGDIRWKKVNGCAGYELYRKRSADGTKKVATINNPNTLQYIDPGIKDNCWGRVYTYYVVPLYGTKKVAGPKSAEVTLQRLAPMKFTKAVNLSGRKMSLAWACTTNSNKANGYEIQYAATKADLFAGKGKKVTFNSRNKLSTTATAPKLGQTYYFRIRAYVLYTHSVTGQQTRTWSQYSDVVSVKVSKGY